MTFIIANSKQRAGLLEHRIVMRTHIRQASGMWKENQCSFQRPDAEGIKMHSDWARIILCRVRGKAP